MVTFVFPNPANAEVALTRLVGQVVGRKFDHWPADAPDIEVERIPGRRGRPAGSIKPDGAYEIGPASFAVVEVETTTDPVVSITKWWRWVEQAPERWLVLIQVFDDRARNASKVRRGEWLGRRAAGIAGDHFTYVSVHAVAGSTRPDDPAVLAALAPAAAAIARLEHTSRPPIGHQSH